MIIGPRGSGKTRIASFIEGRELPQKVTQDVFYREQTIDIPASYLECTWMYQNIIAISQNHAACILALIANEPAMSIYSPAFTKAFNVPVFGIVTHWESGEEMNPSCREELIRAGVREPIAFVNLKDGQGFEEIHECVKLILRKG